MKYDRVLLCISVILAPIGVLLVLDPAAISDAVGLRQSPGLEKACALYESAKQDLVRINGGHVLGIGVFSWILRSVQDPDSQKRVLQAMFASVLVGTMLSLRSIIGGNTTALIWVPVGIQALILGLLTSGYLRLRESPEVDLEG